VKDSREGLETPETPLDLDSLKKALFEWSERAAEVPAVLLSRPRELLYELLKAEARVFDPQHLLEFLLPNLDVHRFLHGLDQVIRFLEVSDKHEAVVGELLEGIQHRNVDVVHALQAMRRLIGEFGSKSANAVLDMPAAVDFHEIYSCVFWAFRTEAEDFFSPYVFGSSRCHYYLLPGAYRELLEYLLKLSSAVRFVDSSLAGDLDQAGKRRLDKHRLEQSIGAVLKSAAMPLDRLKYLLTKGVLLPYPVDPALRSEHRFEEQFERIYYRFEKWRPYRTFPNHNDSLDLALLACLREDGEPLTLITSAPSMYGVARSMELPALRNALRPIEQQAFLLYIGEQERETDSVLRLVAETTTATALRGLEYLQESTKGLLEALKRGEPPRVFRRVLYVSPATMTGAS